MEGVLRKKQTVKAKPKKRKRQPRQVLIVVLSDNGVPRRRAEISWPVGRKFTVYNLANHRDCGRWALPVGWVLRIHNGETNG